MNRRIIGALAALVLAGASMAYGFLVHKSRLFPYKPARSVYQKFFKRPSPTGWRKARPSGAAPGAGGIVVQDRAGMQDGLNLYTSGHAPVVTLMASDGKVLKTWTADLQRAFSGRAIRPAPEEWHRLLNVAHVYPDGGIVALLAHIGLVRLDSSSRVVWSYFSDVRHDLAVAPDGTIWVLSKQDRLVEGLGQGEPVVEDFVEEVSPDGKLRRRVSVLEALRQSDYAPLLTHVAVPGRDLLHVNSIRVLDGSQAQRSPAFRRGNLLLSMGPMDLLAILDPDRGRIVWALAGQWRSPHGARLLSTGHLLLFDSIGAMRFASRVLEVDPFTQEITWSWGTRPGEELFSEASGRVQRLANGNTLICETTNGRAIEVTREGRVVWEFVNPSRAGKKNELVALLYFIERVPADLPFLSASGAR